jgi:hypothetical protein
MKQRSAIDQFDQTLRAKSAPAIDTPLSDMSFFAWLTTFARVRVGNRYVPYSVDGREPLFTAILVLDFVLGNDCSYANAATRLRILGTDHYGDIVPDARVDICGGAQFGKTILALLLKTYLGTVTFRGCMYCLPDDDLVQGIIDTKERPDVIDQIPYVGKMLQIGKALTASGRAANRKGAMLYTDGKRNAVSMMRGLGKFPTTFTCDVVIVDERDDVREEFADYLPGRMTISDLRLMISLGTQRYHGAGQNALYEEGSQHVGIVACPACGRRHNLEEDWPDVCRLSVSGNRSTRDPRLDNSGRFCVGSEPVAKYHPEFDYYFACLDCGAPLDREAIHYEARQPDRIAARHWSVRVAQLSCSALPVSMFVADWCTQAVRKTNKRVAFNCDRLAIPKSTGQKLAPAILERAEKVAPYSLTLSPGEAPHRFGGLDTGDQCWFVCRDKDGERRRLLWAESVADSDAASRCAALFATLKLDCLFVDAGPLRDLARDLALSINNLRTVDIRQFQDWEKKRIKFAGGVEWDGERGVWLGLRCAPVEFSGKPGSGIQQQARLTPDNAHVYPVISCNRDEAIQAVIDDLLTAEDGFAQVDAATGALRTAPVYLLPQRGENTPAILETYRKHLLAGSCKTRDADGKDEHFVDGIANHLLLATTYARLAEEFAGAAFDAKPPLTPQPFRTRLSRILRARREREVIA